MPGFATLTALLMKALVACVTSKQRDEGLHHPVDGRCWKTPKLSRSPHGTKKMSAKSFGRFVLLPLTVVNARKVKVGDPCYVKKAYKLTEIPPMQPQTEQASVSGRRYDPWQRYGLLRQRTCAFNLLVECIPLESVA
jgi:hypothetical protein